MDKKRRYLLKGAIASVLFSQSGQAFAKEEETDLEAIEDEIASSIEEELRLLDGKKVEGLLVNTGDDVSAPKWLQSIIPPIYPDINPIVSPTAAFRRQMPALDSRLSKKLRQKVRYLADV